jgi:hypothetical protein
MLPKPADNGKLNTPTENEVVVPLPVSPEEATPMPFESGTQSYAETLM